MKIAIITLALPLALTGCDHIVKQITPGAHKLVEAEANEGVNRGMMVGWLACSGKVEVTQTANGYAVNFTDRQWNDGKTEYVDVDTYLQTKRVTVRPMNAEEISVCNGTAFQFLRLSCLKPRVLLPKPEVTTVMTRMATSCLTNSLLSVALFSVAAPVKHENQGLNGRSCLLLGGHGLSNGKRVRKRLPITNIQPKRLSTHAEQQRKQVAPRLLHRGISDGQRNQRIATGQGGTKMVVGERSLLRSMTSSHGYGRLQSTAWG